MEERMDDRMSMIMGDLESMRGRKEEWRRGKKEVRMELRKWRKTGGGGERYREVKRG